MQSAASVARRVPETLRYGVVAGGVMVLYIGLYTLGVLLGLHYFASILIAQVVAIAVAFPLYRVFVFRSIGSVRSDFLKFLSVWVTGAVAGVVATPLMVELLGINPLLAQPIAVVVIGVGSFLSHKYFSFRSSEAREKPPSVERQSL